MVKTSQHLAGAGCQVKVKMWSMYVWLIVCGFTSEISCTDSKSGKQIEAQTTSTTSSNDEVSRAQTYTEENFLDSYNNQYSDDSDLHRFVRAVPRFKPKTESSEEKTKNDRKLDYVVKIPLSVLRQQDLYRLIMLEQFGEKGKYKKRHSVIPTLRYGRSGNKNEYDIKSTDNMFRYVNPEEEHFPEEYLIESVEEEPGKSVSNVRNKRSMLLLSAPKSEDTAKEKPAQTFVLPYPRPGRSIYQNELSKMFTQNDIDKKYVLSTPRFDRSSSDSIFGKEEDAITADDWISSVKYSPRYLKMNKEKIFGNTEDENEENSLFVIPYPRPGKRSMFKFKNRNSELKNVEKEIKDYVLPYPRPGKKAVREKLIFDSSELDTENINSQNLVLRDPRPEDADEFSSDISNIYDLSDVFNKNGNDDGGNIMEDKNNEMIPAEEFNGMFVTLNKKFENKSILPYLRTGRNFDRIIPYPRPGRSTSHGNVVMHLLSDNTNPGSNKFLFPEIGFRNSKDNFRYKRSTSVVPYPRLGRSNAVVPYPRLGRSNVVVPYPRLGRSDSVVPYPRLGRSLVVPYPRLGRSDSHYNAAAHYPKLRYANSIISFPFSGRSKRSSSVLPYPRLGRSNSIVPYPRPGRSESVVPYPRPGRSESVVPYPRIGRAESLVPYPRPGRSESVVPYPRPGRSESVVPYPRPGRAESIVPYPRPGRAESIVPYPRPGRAESIVAYPRPGRSDSLVPYPRPGRSNSVVPYPRIGRSSIDKTELPNQYSKEEKWLLPNIRPGRSNLKPEGNQNIALNLQSEKSVEEPTSEYMGASNKALSKLSSITRYDRASNSQGYVLPHPRIGRSLPLERKKREYIDTDTVIPYPRLGRSQKETITYSPDIQNSVHKLNKHMLTNLEDSVYLLPYPRPGRYLE